MQQNKQIHNEKNTEISRSLDAIRDINLAYWAALLTVNGIIIAVFSTNTALYNSHRFTVSAILICALISSILLVTNFQATKNIFLNKLDVLQGRARVAQENIRDALNAHENVTKREGRALFLLIAEVIFMIVLICAELLSKV